MAVVENDGIGLVRSSNRSDTFCFSENDAVDSDPHGHHHPSKMMAAAESVTGLKSTRISQPTDENYKIKFGTHQEEKISTSQQQNSGRLPTVASNSEALSEEHKQSVSFTEDNHHMIKGDDDGVGEGVVNGGNDGFKKDMKDLQEMLSKLNPMAEEFVPPSFVNHNHQWPALAAAGHFEHSANNYAVHDHAGKIKGYPTTKKKSGYPNGKRKLNGRTGLAQRDDVIRRTVYVSDLDHQVTEEQLANLFLHCGQVVDCRVCGDPNSVLRFAFIEFTDEVGAFNALSLSGTMLGFYPVMVQPSKTAIAPVNPTFLPRSEDEREMCTRTIYCTNIDKQVIAADVKLFFESLCGEVQRLRLLGDYNHPTRIAFVEFVRAESAIAALNCSGAILGSLPLRVSPSKTPVRARLARPSVH